MGFVQIDFLTLWNRDAGAPVLCEFWRRLRGQSTTDFLGLRIFVTGHDLDNEWSSMLVAAPTPGNARDVYEADASAYRAYFVRTAAHENAGPLGLGLFDKSAYHAFASGGIPFDHHAHLWLSAHKHATYPGNPDGLLVIPPLLYAGAVVGIELAERILRRWFDRKFIRWLIAAARFILFFVFVICPIEEHFDERGSHLGRDPANVGEVLDPEDGYRYIQDPRPEIGLAPKLDQDLWSWYLDDPSWL